MSAVIAGAAAKDGAGAGLRPLLAVVVALGAAVVLGERLWIALAQPLWFDETWTGAIAGAESWPAFAREVWLDVNAPLYYLVMRGWTAVFGLSDLSLKAPGLIGAALAGALPLLVRVRGLSLEARLAWAGLITAWWGVDSFLEARCYGLLLAICVAQTLAFARMVERPTTRAALAWSALAALAILTQYYALALAAVQGLLYLGLHGRRALRTWPAALAFVPAFAWIGVHAPRLAQYATDDVAWHPRIGARQALDLFAFTVGPANAAALALTAGVLALAILAPRLMRSAQRDEPSAGASPLAWAAASGLIALALVLASAMWRPTLTARYLIPEVPAMLLGLVLLARRSPRAHLTYLALLLLAFAGAVRPPAAVAEARRSPSQYGLALASEALRAQRVSDVSFIWDHPAAKIIDAGSLQRVGGFFFDRAGASVRVTPLYVDAGRDPNRQALDAASGSRPGIIWIYDRTGRTAAARHPPAIERMDAGWRCRSFGDAWIGSLACWRR